MPHECSNFTVFEFFHEQFVLLPVATKAGIDFEIVEAFDINQVWLNFNLIWASKWLQLKWLPALFGNDMVCNMHITRNIQPDAQFYDETKYFGHFLKNFTQKCREKSHGLFFSSPKWYFFFNPILSAKKSGPRTTPCAPPRMPTRRMPPTSAISHAAATSSTWRRRTSKGCGPTSGRCLRLPMPCVCCKIFLVNVCRRSFWILGRWNASILSLKL